MKQFLTMFGGSFIVVILWFGIAYFTGQTFGQQCTKEHPVGSLEWDRCIDKLIKGEYIGPLQNGK